MVGKLSFAVVADTNKHRIRSLACMLLVLQAVGVGVLMLADSVSLALVALVFIGFGSGCTIPLHPFINSIYFDESVIGAVNGGQVPMMLPFSLLGIPLAGYAFDATGSYFPAFAAVALLLFLGGMLLLLLPAPPGKGVDSRN